jgi:hypothetical protein
MRMVTTVVVTTVMGMSTRSQTKSSAVHKNATPRT